MKDVILNSGKLYDSELQHSYLMNANLSGIFIDKGCNLQDANLVGANLQHAIFEPELHIEGVTLFKADLRQATMKNVKFVLCNMVEAKLQNSQLQGSLFDYCAMMGVKLKGANMSGITLKNSILSDVSLEDLDLSNAEIEGGVWMKILNFNRLIVTGAKFYKPLPLGMNQDLIDYLKMGGAEVDIEREVGVIRHPLMQELQETNMNKSFHVFFSHNSQDKPIVRELAQALKSYNLRVWLDEEQLVPGHPWLEALETIIQTTKAAAVLIGESGLGPWEEPEMRACLSEFVKRKLPVIPVLLPGTPTAPKLPLFLRSITWVDLRDGLTKPGLEKLVWGITGVKTGKAS